MSNDTPVEIQAPREKLISTPSTRTSATAAASHARRERSRSMLQTAEDDGGRHRRPVDVGILERAARAPEVGEEVVGAGNELEVAGERGRRRDQASDT